MLLTNEDFFFMMIFNSLNPLFHDFSRGRLSEKLYDAWRNRIFDVRYSIGHPVETGVMDIGAVGYLGHLLRKYLGDKLGLGLVSTTWNR